YPEGRVIHMVRDPRDRYASVSRRNGGHLDRVGAATGRWLLSARAARRNAAAYPDRYLRVRFEDLVAEPREVMEQVCQFVGVDFIPSMMEMGAVPDLRDRGGNSSFGDGAPGTISRNPVGRYRDVLDPTDIAFIQQVAGREMDRQGYTRQGIDGLPRVRYAIRTFPRHLLRMAGWIVKLRLRIWRGIRVPDRRLDPSGTSRGGEAHD
ncbi:MAG: sulfotransferase, partial [Acidimicrobiia bacterium]|nr:sulfotransferase [Acidimicrobiia bacterium]